MRIPSFVFLAAPLALLGVGYLQVSLDPNTKATRAMSAEVGRLQVQQLIESESTTAARATAEGRYSSGNCLLTDRLDRGQQFQQVPPGSVICDRYGWTARVDEYGLVADMAYTDNQDLIRRLWGW